MSPITGYVSGCLGSVQTAPLDPATIAWVNAVITNGGTVSAGRQTVVNNLISGLKTDGIFTKIDRLWLFAGENQPSALTDIINDQLATNVNSTTFTVDRGFTGNGTSMHIDSNVTTPPSGTLYAQNSASIFVWSNTSGSDNNAMCGLGSGADVYIYPNQSGTRFFGINVGSAGGGFTFSFSVANGLGWHHANRSGASSQEAYTNGSQLGTSSVASAGLSISSFACLFENGNFSSSQSSAFGFGGSLTSTDASNFYTRMRSYMSSVGVP